MLDTQKTFEEQHIQEGKVLKVMSKGQALAIAIGGKGKRASSDGRAADEAKKQEAAKVVAREAMAGGSTQAGQEQQAAAEVSAFTHFEVWGPKSSAVAALGGAADVLELIRALVTAYKKGDGVQGIFFNALLGNNKGEEVRLTFWNKAAAAASGVVAVEDGVRCHGGRVGDLYFGKRQVNFEMDPRCERVKPEGCRMLMEPMPISEIVMSKKQHGIDVQGIVLSDSGILRRSGKKLREITVGDHSKYCVRPGSRKAAEHHCVRTLGEGVGGRRGRAVGRWRPRGRDGGAFRFSHQGDAVGRLRGEGGGLLDAAWSEFAGCHREGVFRRCVFVAGA